MSHAETMVEGLSLEDAVVKLCNYYFSVENLKRDTFLQQHMDADGYVGIDLLLQFPMMVKVHASTTDVLNAAKHADAVEIDTARKLIRAKTRFLSTTLILRDVLDTVVEADVLELFNDATVPKPVSVRKEAGRMWYLSFDSEAATYKVEEYLVGKKLKDKDIRSRIKAEPIVKPPVFVAPVPEESPFEMKAGAAPFTPFEPEKTHHGKRKGNGPRRGGEYHGRGGQRGGRGGFRSYTKSAPVKQDASNFPPLKTPATTYTETDFTNILKHMDAGDLTLPADASEALRKWEIQILLETPVRSLEVEKPMPADHESLAPMRPRDNSVRSSDGHGKSRSPRKNKGRPTAAEIAAKAAGLPPPPVVNNKGSHAAKDDKKTTETAPAPAEAKPAAETKAAEKPVEAKPAEQAKPAEKPAEAKPTEVKAEATPADAAAKEAEDDKLSFVEVIKKNKGSKNKAK